jgi:hypothetical protein
MIAIHDELDKVCSMGEPSATSVVEADYLDRYGPESHPRFPDMFGSMFSMGSIARREKSILSRASISGLRHRPPGTWRKNWPGKRALSDKHEMDITYNSERAPIHQQGKGVSFKS